MANDRRQTKPAARRVAAATAIAAALAAPAEGIKLTPYYDPPGILTVCRGHTGPDIIKGRTYSLAECDALLEQDMREAVAAVERCVPGLPPHQLAAWSDAVYNIGPTIVCDTTRSTAARLLASGRRDEACDQLPRWDKARVAGILTALPGLTKRRAIEARLCRTGELLPWK